MICTIANVYVLSDSYFEITVAPVFFQCQLSAVESKNITLA
jgi:hypothetical protein